MHTVCIGVNFSMKGKTKKTILLVLLAVAAIAAFIAYSMYNKEHFSVQNAKPAAMVTAVELHSVFSIDSVLAKNKFTGDETNQKVIQVEGDVAEIKKDQTGQTLILLKTGTGGAFINCTFEEEGSTAIPGNKITIKGICSGYNFDAEMGIPGDVILTRCHIVKN
jgi:tRNA_anti-like